MTEPYESRFNNIHRGVLDASKRLMRSRIGQLRAAEATVLMQGWLDEVSAIYGMSAPSVAIVSAAEAYGSGVYFPALNAIKLPHASNVSLFHEFRHAMQAQGKANPFISNGPFPGPAIEHDARAWSLSLYRTIAPRTFERLAGEGQIFYVNVDRDAAENGSRPS